MNRTKVKLLSAYERDDSVTIRITPESMVRLLFKSNGANIDLMCEEVRRCSFSMTDDRKDLMRDLLSKLHDSI